MMIMTKEEALYRVKGYLTDIIPTEDYNEVEEIIKALEQEPCEDCISRKAVFDMCKKEIDHISKNWQNYHSPSEAKSGFVYISTNIYDFPPVTPQPKTGHWIAQDIHNCHTDFKCSECGYIHSFMHLYAEPTADYTYCPKCGARMEGE